MAILKTPRRSTVIAVQVKQQPDAVYNASLQVVLHPEDGRTRSSLKRAEPSRHERFNVELTHYNWILGGVTTTVVGAEFRKREWAEQFAQDYRKLLKEQMRPTLGERCFAFAYLRLHPIAERILVGWAWTKAILAKPLQRPARTGEPSADPLETP